MPVGDRSIWVARVVLTSTVLRWHAGMWGGCSRMSGGPSLPRRELQHPRVAVSARSRPIFQEESQFEPPITRPTRTDCLLWDSDPPRAGDRLPLRSGAQGLRGPGGAPRGRIRRSGLSGRAFGEGLRGSRPARRPRLVHRQERISRSHGSRGRRSSAAVS
jgi:hypothetical protein